MPEIKRTFNVGKINRDLDDRIVPPGEYREALNISIGQSDSSDVGAIENLLGNEVVAASGISGEAKCIGSFGDGAAEKIYYFVTNNSAYNEANTGDHGIFEYNQKSKQLSALIISSQLNFHIKYPITGINLVDGLLFFTDNRNAPRKINVETASNNTSYYTSVPDIDNLISVCKFAPYESATLVSATKESSISSTFLQDKLVRFSYRWKFDDNEYSILAPFTPICFSRLNELDSISSSLSNFGEIETFLNAINQIQLQVPTPTGYGIKNVELIYKESGSSTLYVAADQEVTTESFVNFKYSSTDPFRTLPGDQLTRVYDSVPRKALAQEVGGGRLVYGNFLQNYNIPEIAFSVARTGEASARNSMLENQSVKSRRTYQVGIVLADKFGRQSPVILSSSGVDTVYIEPNTGAADSTTAFNALRITFTDTDQIPDWAYSYRVVVKQRAQEYYNWISVVSSQNVVERLGDSINKVPRDQTAAIPPSTSSSISPCDVSVYPKYLDGNNVYSTPQANLTKIQSIANPTGTALVTTLNNNGSAVSSGLCVFETEPTYSELDIFYETSTGGLVSDIPATAIDINFFNCILLNFDPGGSGDNHIEINRIRAGYNEPFFDIGVRAFVVKENFTEERRNNTLIHSSGLLNSRTGINYINQFNETEGGLTVSLDPINGSIQKLFTDDTQIEVYQESKVSRSPIDKDFIYSAEGGAVPVTSNTQFLGTVSAYPGQFGISKNPKSFASYGFSRFFTDKDRGTVLRLMQGNMQEISLIGMSDFMRDALKSAKDIIGSYDEHSNLYELTIVGPGYDSNKDTNVATASQGYLTLSFDDRSNGWVSFKSFKQESGVSLNNTYYTFNNGNLWQHHSENVTRNNFYGTGTAESYVIPIFNDAPSLVKQYNTLNYEGTSGWELSYIETDISEMGDIPATTNSYNTTLQLSGSADNSIFNGNNTATAKEGETVSWVIFVSPLNSQYAFNNVSDVVLTPSTGSNLNVTNPTIITDNKLVFLIEHTVSNTNSIQTLDISGVGASLAFTVSLLTVNVIDSMAFADITPASLVFNTSGPNSVVFSTAVEDNYYVDNSNVIINTSGMPSSTSPGVVTNVQNVNNITYTLPITVPSTAAAGTVTVTGSAILMPTLQWNAVDPSSGGVLNTPVGTSVGSPYHVSPFGDDSTRLATVVFTAAANQVFDISSFTVSSNITGATVSNALSGGVGGANPLDGVLTASVQLPVLTTDTIAASTITGSGSVAATLGSIPSTISLNSDGDSVSIPGNWNVQIQLDPTIPGTEQWLEFNGSVGTHVVQRDTGFNISGLENTTGSSRSATALITNRNTRVVTSPNATHTITITQAG